MRSDDLLLKLQKNIRINLSQKHLINLCTYFNLPISGRKNQIQEKLINFTNTQSHETLKSMSNKADEYLRLSSSTRPRNTTTINRTSIRIVPEVLTESKLQTALINLLDEVPLNLRTDLSNPVITPQMELTTTFPPKPTKLPFVDYPNILLNKQVITSPFHCCQVCLQPLTLLNYMQAPNFVVRVNTTQPLNFIITENVRNLISNNQYKVNGKIEYKWQVLLRFVGIDVTQAKEVFANPPEIFPENIPPYMSLIVNEISHPLWDVLPSNHKLKEGRRHPKPIQITDKLKLNTRNASGGYKQLVSMTWWQIPEITPYFYVGVYLERKISVREMMSLYAPNSLFNNRPMDEILAWVRNKFGKAPNNSQNDDDCDDLVISNVLPINLNCPVSKSRIGIPLRTIRCEHLQCFDAVFFLSMNERRSVWKCPICDEQATPNDLFTDKFFLSILQHFKNDEEVSDVNVNPDNSFVAVTQNRDREQVENPMPRNENSVVNQASTQPVQDLIVLDSDEEEDVVSTIQKPSVEIQQSNQLSTGLPKLLSAPTSHTPKQVQPPPKTTPSSIHKSTPVRESAVPSVPPPYATPLASLKPVDTNLQDSATKVTSSSTDSQSISNQTNRRTQSNATEVRTTKSIVTTPSERSTNSSTSNIFSSVTQTPISSIISSIVPPQITNNPILIPPFVSNSPVSLNAFPPQQFPGKPASSFMGCAISSTIAPIASSTLSNSVLNSVNLIKSVPATVPSAFGNPISVISSRTLSDKNPNSIIPPRKSPITTSVQNNTTETTSKESLISNSSSKSLISSISTSADIQSRNSSWKSRSEVQISSANLQPPSTMTGVIGEVSTKDIVDDIVRTLPVTNIPDVPTKKRTADHSPEPINCPNIIVHQPDKKNDTPAKTPDQIKKLDNQKRLKTFQSKIPPPSSNVTIPSLTIDLTAEDDEEQQTSVNIKQAVPLAQKSMTWVPVSGPISNNLNKMINGINMTKFPTNHLNRSATNNRNIENEKRKLAELGIGHYKPHQMLHSNFSVKSPKAHIDLTADDDDEDRIPNKRPRFGNSDNAAAVVTVLGSDINTADEEDGQINDNESTASNNSSNVKGAHNKNALHVVSKRKL